MAPAAMDTILMNLKDFDRQAEDYDRIITGDLGAVGQKLLLDMIYKKGVDLQEKHLDCGMLIFDAKEQAIHMREEAGADVRQSRLRPIFYQR